MGKLNSFDIFFDNQNGIFYSGSFVEGNVVIDLSAPMKMRGVHIKFKGRAKVHWTENSSDEHSDRHYEAKEKYFVKDILLFGNAPSENYSSVELDTGHHDLPFRFQLPQGLPSSFEATEGQVQYKATSKIVRLDKEDYEAKRHFTVVSVLDLNLRSEYKGRLSGSNQKHLCCCCCKSGPISAQFSIERQGWVPGEAIRLYADIRNGASRTIDKSYVNLTMKTTFLAKDKSKEARKEVARVTRPSIQGLSEDSWRGELLFIPALPPTNLGGCKIIDVQYILQLNVDPSGPSLDMEVPLSIVIGTIPLSVLDQPPPFGGQASAPPLPYQSGPSAPPSFLPLGFQNQPPPSYMESMLAAGVGYADASGAGEERTLLNPNRSFTPSYTFYNNWGDPAPAPPPFEESKKS